MEFYEVYIAHYFLVDQRAAVHQYFSFQMLFLLCMQK